MFVEFFFLLALGTAYDGLPPDGSCFDRDVMTEIAFRRVNEALEGDARFDPLKDRHRVEIVTDTVSPARSGEPDEYRLFIFHPRDVGTEWSVAVFCQGGTNLGSEDVEPAVAQQP